jgi:beta-barrel assembly-enhancing protease
VRTGPRNRTILAVREELRVKLPLLLLLACLLTAGCTMQQRGAPGGAAASPASADATAADIKEAQSLVGNSQWPQADAFLTRTLARRDFAQLAPGQKHTLVSLAAIAALQTRDPRRALALSRQACGFATSDARDWFTRMRAADAAADPKDAVYALTTLAERWPQVLARLPGYEAVANVMGADLRAAPSDAARYELLAALHKIKFLDEPRGSGEWWREFALLQLARGERLSAVQTLARITDPYVIVSIEADRRFDAVRSEPGALVSVPQAAEQSIETEVRHAQLTPERLEPTNHLAEILVNLARQRQALSVTDGAIEYQETHGTAAWSDYGAQYVWILINRADALYSLGRHQAAVAQMEAASHLHEDPGENVNATINLAGMYNDLGQTQQAAATLQRVSPADLSSYGRMQLQGEKLRVALALHDEQAATRALDYLRTHREDEIGAYQEALLAAHRDDDGAALLIARLHEPQERSNALLAVQVYAEDAEPAAVLEEHTRWRALVNRGDVQQAIDAVGRIAEYPLLVPEN